MPLKNNHKCIGATFSPCEKYRYLLWREWAKVGQTCLFIMLNPSTADESVDDPTIRRCVSFCKTWGYSRLEVVNLFALRSTNPDVLRKVSKPVGVLNNRTILEASVRASRVIAAWGIGGSLNNRAREVCALLNKTVDIYCLGKTQSGFPKHPLYLKSDTIPQIFSLSIKGEKR